jgi:hypothetical protein
VQLYVDGVPSTQDTTGSNGRFAIRAVLTPSASVKFDIVPPPSSGLPRLLATSTSFNLAQDVPIQFAAIATRDLGGSVVRRGGAPVPNAQLVVVGSVANAGTVGGVTGGGIVRLSATANGGGTVPSLRAPAVQLTAVVEASTGDWSQSALDLTGGVPATINAPAMTAVSTTVLPPSGTTGLADVTLDLVPRGALADAGVPAMRVRSASDGSIATDLVAGASYDLYFTDPGRRGAQRKLTNVTAVPANVRLLQLTDVTITIDDGTNPLPDVLVQLRCPDCTGLDRSRAIAEGLTGPDGRITLAVERP